MAKKQRESNISIKDNISKIDDKINKVLNIISIKKTINDNDKSEHEYEQFESDEKEIIYEIPKKKKVKW